jgi:hypothetical protein
MRVVLTWPEIYIAADVARMRTIGNLRRGCRDRYGASGLGADSHLCGCIGEMASAKHLNKFWAGSIGDYEAVDIDRKYQVRATSKASHCLLLHKDDRDDLPFILALVLPEILPYVELPGWLLAKDGKLDDFWGDPTGYRPAYFVPQSKLRDMSELSI